jgi:hypothetical protein
MHFLQMVDLVIEVGMLMLMMALALFLKVISMDGSLAIVLDSVRS